MFLKKKADSLFSSVELHSTMWKFNENNVTPYDNSFRVVTSRDKLGSNIVDNGSFYITKKNLFKKAKHRLAGKKIISYIMKNWTIFEIDSKKDFQTVEWMMSSKKNRPKQIILI